ncbi:hypothetical protein Bbelb_324090 [Branchiostoma belcheri]|nr:hypothetical protein Bbelb_324090 [Branchiostoma belcheri]
METDGEGQKFEARRHALERSRRQRRTYVRRGQHGKRRSKEDGTMPRDRRLNFARAGAGWCSLPCERPVETCTTAQLEQNSTAGPKSPSLTSSCALTNLRERSLDFDSDDSTGKRRPGLNAYGETRSTSRARLVGLPALSYGVRPTAMNLNQWPWNAQHISMMHGCVCCVVNMGICS